MKSRKAVNKNWTFKSGGKLLKIKIIEPEDLELIGNFYNEHYVKHGNLWKSIKITADECKQLSFDTVKVAIQKAVSLAVFDGDKLVAVQLNRLHSPDEFPQLFDGQLHHDNPKLVIKDDYAEDIRNGPYNLQTNRIYCLLNDTLKQVGKFLPKTSRNIGYFKAAAVLPEYQNTGLGGYLGNITTKLFYQDGCEYIIGFALVNTTHNFATKLGMKECFKLPYSEYKENGKPVFEDLSKDGGSIRFLYGKADVAMKVVTEAEETPTRKNFWNDLLADAEKNEQNKKFSKI